ncbi:AraC family transcriptional regulator ligand-binding domain-containing protein [Pseudomonas nitroreducens]|uniref:AraC family transcriptional regulator ligand-binding domain-containing protein n=1 Tax=Pseudomonas nitroreducens TaxID=46680 RepID=UPI001CA965E1|nr:AraC family transcriptional regulator ligand-binding domain-containing protein [Pseudomonas nitritireducens]
MQKKTFPIKIGWQPLLKDLGLKPGHVLRRAGLPDDLLSRGAPGLSTADYFRFWYALEIEAGAPLFPLRLVDTLSAETFDPPLFAALCSANLMQAVQRLAKYKQLVAPMRLEVEVGKDGDLTLTPQWLSVQAEVPCSLQVAELAFFLRLARLATCEPAKALRVTLPKVPPSDHARRYESFFGTPAQQGTSPSVTFAAVDALRPFITLNENMWRVFEPDLRRRLGELDATATTADRVRAALLELLPGKIPIPSTAHFRTGLVRHPAASDMLSA